MTIPTPQSRPRGGRLGQSRLSMYLPEDMHERLRRRACDLDTTVTEIVRELVERELAALEEEQN